MTNPASGSEQLSRAGDPDARILNASDNMARLWSSWTGSYCKSPRLSAGVPASTPTLAKDSRDKCWRAIDRIPITHRSSDGEFLSDHT